MAVVCVRDEDGLDQSGDKKVESCRWILNIFGIRLGPGLDVRSKEMRRVGDDYASGFSNWVDGCAKYWEREDLGRTRFVSRRGMGMRKKGHVKFEMLRNHPHVLLGVQI